MYKTIYVLVATEEGPNTFWSPTVWTSVEEAKAHFPEMVYRKSPFGVQSLAASIEGPNTRWQVQDEYCHEDWTVKDWLRYCTPVDVHRVYVDKIPEHKPAEA